MGTASASIRDSGLAPRGRPADPVGMRSRFLPAALAGLGSRLRPLLDRAILRATSLVAGREPHPLEPALGLAQRLRRWAAWEGAARRGDHGFLEAGHARFWRSANDGAWYQRTAHRFESWFLREHGEFIEAVVRAVAGDPRWVHFWEIGTGDGRVLEYFAGRLPGVGDFTGIDLNEARIARNRSARSGRLRFVCADAAAFVREHGQPGSVLLTNAGVFEYFAPAVLAELFAHVGERLAPGGLALIEPLADDMDLDRESASRPFGAERSFSHNYPRLLADAGFEIVHRREKRVKGHRFIELVALRDA